jgi:hypothetical protein
MNSFISTAERPDYLIFGDDVTFLIFRAVSISCKEKAWKDQCGKVNEVFLAWVPQ